MDEASSSTGVGAQGHGGGSGDGDGARKQEQQPLEETLQQQGPKKDKKGKWAELIRGKAAKLLGRSGGSGKAKEEEEDAVGRGGGERRRRTTTTTLVREELERAMRAVAGRIERGDVGARGEAYDEMEAVLEGLLEVCFKKAAENAAPPQCFRSGNWTSTQPMQDPVIVASGYVSI